MPAALSTFAGSGQTVSAYNSANNTFTIAGNGSAAPFHMDDEPNDVTGRTLVFTNGAFPQFDFSGSFGDSTGLTRTAIIESSTAGQPGRTAYYAATNRFRGTEAVTPLQLWNVDWKIDSSDGSEGNSKESAFNIGGSPSSSDLNGRLIEFRGVNVEGAFADNVWHNQRARIINNPQRGFGLRLWMKLASNTLPFTLVVACAPAANPSGLVLLRGTTTPVASSLQYFANDLDANTTLTLSGLSAAGVGVFPSGGNVDNTTVALIDPVGNPGKLGTPFSGGSLVWGRLRTFRTQTINYTGATFTGSEHLVISNSTASAPAWTNPANLTSNTDGVFAPVVAVKEVAHGTRNETTYANYSIYTVGMNYRRKADTFTLSSTTAPLTDQNITLTPETMANGSAITSLVIDNDNADSAFHADDLDKVFRAVKTHEVASPSHEMTDAYMINNAGTYEVKNGSGAAGTIQFSGVDHSLELNTSSSHITLYDLGGVTIGAGNADGLRAAGIQAINSPTHGTPVLNFPRAESDSAVTIRRVSVTGALDWTGAVHTATGTNVGGLLEFSSGNLTRSFLTSTTGGIILTTARAGYVPGRVTTTIASDAALSLEYTILGGAQETFASTGGAKYSSTLSGSTYGTASFDTSTFSDPKAYVEIADRQINAQAAYSIFHAGLLTLAGQKFLAANGATINVEDIASSGQFVFLNGDTLLRRAASGNSNAALTAEPIRADAMFVEDDRGDVPYIPGISLSGINTKLDAIQTSVNNIDSGGGGGGASVAEIVTGIRAANFATSGTAMTLGQRLDTIDGDIAAVPTTSQIATAVSGALTIPTTAQIVTAIQAADFGTPSGTQTLANRIAAILTAIDDLNDLSAAQVTAAVPSVSQIAAAITIPTPPTAQEIATQVIADLPPYVTADAIATAVLAKTIETGMDMTETLQVLLAVLTGTTSRTDNQITFNRLDSAATAKVRASTDDTTRTRTSVTVL